MPKTLSVLTGVILASCSPPGPTPQEPRPAAPLAAPASPDPSSTAAASPDPRADADPAAPGSVEAHDAVRGPQRVLMDGGMSLEGLEQLFAATPKGAPERPRLMRRLAEAYVELETGARRSETEHAVRRAEAKRAGNTSREEAEAAEEAKAAKTVEGARRRAIAYYSRLAGEYPQWCQGGAHGGCADEVLYDLAFEHETGREPAEARKVYVELIKKYPQSRFLPNAYLALGEQFFEEAAGDPPKLALAEQAYLEVIKYPPPDNKVAGYAHYKLAYVYWTKGESARALSEMTKAIDVCQTHPSSTGAQLAKAARHDLAGLYAIAGDPHKAYAFLSRWSGDPPGRTDGLDRLLDDVAQSYLDRGKPDAVAQVSLAWLEHGAGGKTCDVVGRLDAALAGKGVSREVQAAAAGSAPLKTARAQCPAAPRPAVP